MKNLRNLTLFSIALLSLSGCKKEENRYSTKKETVSGYVTDVVTDDSLPNVKLRLRADSRGGSNQLSDFEQVLDSTYSDANGYYQFSFECTPDAPYGREAFSYYAVEPVKEHYWKSPNMTLTSFGCGDNYLDRSDVNIFPLTWIKVHIRNDPPAQASDSIYYNGPVDHGPIHSKEYSSYAHRVSAKGAEVDTLFYVTIKANIAPPHFWDVTENGSTTRNASFISCDPLDTCELDIFY